MFIKEVLKLLQGLKGNILVDTGEEIRGVSEILISKDRGYIFVLAPVQQGVQDEQTDQEQQGGPEQQDDSQNKLEIVHKKYIAKLSPNIKSRQQIFQQVKQWPHWMQVELSEALDCAVAQVPAALADHLNWTEEKTETAQTETGEEKENPEK